MARIVSIIWNHAVHVYENTYCVLLKTSSTFEFLWTLESGYCFSADFHALCGQLTMWPSYSDWSSSHCSCLHYCSDRRTSSSLIGMATEWEIKIWDGDSQVWLSQMLYHILIIIKPLNIPINSCIIESVDSICRDSAGTQYMLIRHCPNNTLD